jgi:3-hydroxybutyryl-CoA dehydrogenase
MSDARHVGRPGGTLGRQIVVVGGGLMGRGIAEVAALAGSEVVLYDIEKRVRDQARGKIRRSLDESVARGLVDVGTAREALERIEVREALQDLGACDAVVEAVVEDLCVKCAVFEELDRLTGPRTLLVTNTSALSVTEIAAATSRPHDLVGMHFFNPVPRMRLVEIVRGLETSDATLERAHALAVYLGKEAITVSDSPGFITTRVNALIGNEAFLLLTEGVASAEDIDSALKAGLNHPMGPFELVDLVGLDTRLRVLEHLHATLGEKYRPSPLLRRYVAAGRLGRKVGRGVFAYEGARAGV